MMVVLLLLLLAVQRGDASATTKECNRYCASSDIMVYSTGAQWTSSSLSTAQAKCDSTTGCYAVYDQNCDGGTYKLCTSSTGSESGVGSCLYNYKSSPRYGCCGAGKYVSLGSTRSCHSCTAGKYQDATAHGLESCKYCPGGKYTGLTGRSSCSTCAAGKFQGSGSSSWSSCDSCSRGRYSSSGASSCPSCAKGKYSSSTGRSYCSTCPSGKTTSSTGSSSSSYCVGGSCSSTCIGYANDDDCDSSRGCNVAACAYDSGDCPSSGGHCGVGRYKWTGDCVKCYSGKFQSSGYSTSSVSQALDC
jgi:hypothetical protein